jgi:hypothetical protein
MSFYLQVSTYKFLPTSLYQESIRSLYLQVSTYESIPIPRAYHKSLGAYHESLSTSFYLQVSTYKYITIPSLP